MAAGPQPLVAAEAQTLEAAEGQTVEAQTEGAHRAEARMARANAGSDGAVAGRKVVDTRSGGTVLVFVEARHLKQDIFLFG